MKFTEIQSLARSYEHTLDSVEVFRAALSDANIRDSDWLLCHRMNLNDEPYDFSMRVDRGLVKDLLQKNLEQLLQEKADLERKLDITS